MTVQVPASVNGHRLLSRVRHFPGKNVVAWAVNPTEWHLAQQLRPACEHCRERKAWAETFHFESPNGFTIQVARPCLRDYFHNAATIDGLFENDLPPKYLDVRPVLSAIALLREREPTADHETILGMVRTALEVQEVGGLADDVTEVLYDGIARPPEVEIIRWARGPLREEIDAATAKGVRVNARYIAAANALALDWLPAEALNRLVAVHEVYEEWKAVQAAKPPESQYVGEVREKGEKAHRPRLRLKLVAKLGPFQGDYGDRYGYVFLQDGTPNKLMWWTTSKPGVEINEIAEFDCTIQAHSTYQDSKQTVITRVKKVDHAREAAIKRDRERGEDNSADSD
jgi:hypothetical protein